MRAENRASLELSVSPINDSSDGSSCDSKGEDEEQEREGKEMEGTQEPDASLSTTTTADKNVLNGPH